MDENDESLVFVTIWDCRTHVPMMSSVERTDLDFKISVALLYLDISDLFRDGSSKSNIHSAMTVGKFILVLLDQFKFHFISKLFSLKHENDLKLNYKN